jgi:hypothetical protein
MSMIQGQKWHQNNGFYVLALELVNDRDSGFCDTLKLSNIIYDNSHGFENAIKTDATTMLPNTARHVRTV